MISFQFLPIQFRKKPGQFMTGKANLFSRFGFQVGQDGKIDNYTRAFFSKFKGRVGPTIP